VIPTCPRVISLLPAATEIVAALGAADLLVAISHECDFPPEITHLPRVTASAVDRDASSLDIDTAVRRLSESGRPVFMLDANDVVRLAPTVILTQTLCDVCAVSEGDVRDIAHLVSPAPMIVPLVGTTLDGVWNDIANVGGAIGRSSEANLLLMSLATRIRQVHETLKAARAPRPRVAVIEWLDPLFAAGHWTPELVRRAGGIDVLASAGEHSVRVAIDRVREAQPDVLLFAPCGFDVERSAREAGALLEQPEWAWASGLEAWAIDGNALTSRAGPRLADAVEVMASIFASTLFAALPGHYARRLSLSSRRSERVSGLLSEARRQL
jgi:iron complex transport system substrate-binding protein